MTKPLWRKIAPFLIAFAVSHGFSWGQILSPEAPTVRVETGVLRGSTTNGITSFLGIPYAAPPLGPLRWAAPKPPVLWTGIRDANRMSVPAAQGVIGTPNVSTNEDCLYLNMYVPEHSQTGAAKPVMVWLHGGGFSSGSANDYDPRRMVTVGDVIVITVEFRLNIFGYFGYPGLDDSGTFGLLDQQAALAWIKRNIAAFGGDPTNITLFGESGGAVASCAQLISPTAQGLFQKLILQSGAVTTTWPPNTPNMGLYTSFWRPLKDVEIDGENLTVTMGCPKPRGSRESLQWLRDLPASLLLSHTREFAAAAYGGRVLPHHPAEALKEGRFKAVPILAGFNRDEGRAMALGMQLVGGGEPMTESGYAELLTKAFGPKRAEVEIEYPRARFASPTLAWSAIYTDRMFAQPQLAAMRTLASRAPAFAYEFADTNAPGLLPFFPGFPPGASHSGELPFLFDIENKPIDMTGHQVPLTAEQKALGDLMTRYWTQFAHSGDPNSANTPPWPRFNTNVAQPEVQILASSPQGVEPRSDVLATHHYNFWENFR